MPPPYPASAPRRPRRWLGPWGGLWIAAFCVAIWLFQIGLGYALKPVQPPLPADDNVLDPFLMLTGSWCAAAVFLYTMAYRLDPRSGISVARLIGGGMLAGLLAGLAAGALNGVVNAFSDGTSASPSPVAFITVGPIEEAAKLAATLLLARGLPFKSARTGLFLGGAVGFGFGAIENLAYLELAWSVGAHQHHALGALLTTAISRQLIGPLLHPVLTGLAAAAVFASARGGRRLRFTLAGFGGYLAAAAAHSLYDLGSDAPQWLRNPYVGELVAFVTVVIVLGGCLTAWILVSRRLKRASVRVDRMPPGQAQGEQTDASPDTTGAA